MNDQSANPMQITRRNALLATAGAALVPVLGGGLTAPARAAAPMLGATQPQVYRFQLGEFEIATVSDGAVQVDGPHPIFGNDQPAEQVQDYASQNFLPEEKLEISFTPVVINTGNELVLFDTGNGAARRPAAGALASKLEAAGYTPDQVDVVVLTHFHPDHIGGTMEDGKPTFPNARYVTGRTEYDFWSDEAKLGGPMDRVASLTQSNVVTFADKTTFLEDGGEVVSGIRAVAAPGHTPGHMAFLVESGGKPFLIWGDTTNHYVLSLQKPEWHVSFDMDKDEAVRSRKKILDMVAADRIPATGYHMPFPAIGYVEKAGDGYRWVPVSYQLRL
ncbi:MBL fold metallo-hydrolase [Microbaculum marinum]|uniref:MBL fold metallo-hydrolase n=1 Tax=Microbaculum marinum TaxID=1764581 RepID=A0AAW9RNB4_9HYPH